MALLTPAPTSATTLGRAVREEQAAACDAKRRSSWWRRIVKSLAVTFIALFGALGIGGGTAQAWPWDDLVTAVYYICGPMNVPDPVTYQGFDTSLGLNDVKSDQRHTIVPKIGDDLAGRSGNGLERLSEAYGNGRDAQIIAKPTYERYGFSTLQWTNYGNGCASKSFWLSGVTNFAFDIFIKLPMALGMGLLEWTMAPDNPIYEAFGTLVEPIIGVFGAIFAPWIFFIAPIGVFLIWLRTRSTTQVLKAFIWVVSIYGVFGWMTGVTAAGGGWQQSDNPGVVDGRIDYSDDEPPPTGLSDGLGKITRFASNFVTTFSGNAACKISEATAGGQACDPNNPMRNIHESLWHGVPYQTWLAGELGEEAAEESRRLEAQGQIGWGGAILNGMYVGDDDKGRTVSKAINHWNKGSYAENTDHDAKVGYWTGGDANKPGWSNGTAWEDIPFLANVKFMCNDTAVDDDGSSEEEHNKWMYGGNCDSAGAGTADMVPYFKGEGYSQQIVYAFAGAWATIAIVLTIGLACIYLMLQKMLFWWLLAFGPIFLAISTFADEKRRQFAKRWAELLVANVIKQCVAVIVVLFVSYSMGALIANTSIPWIVKPYAAILFMIALIMFAKPMANIATAAVKGDTSVVDRTASAPQHAAKNAALAAAVVGTGGAVAAAAPALAGTGVGQAVMSGKAGAALTGMGRAAGRGAVGKGLRMAGAGSNLAKTVMDSKASKEGTARAVGAAAQHLVKGDPDGKKYQRDEKGAVTAQGWAQAQKDAKARMADGDHEGKVAKAANESMEKFFRSHETKNGGKPHPADPEKGPKRQGPDEPMAGRPVNEHMARGARDEVTGLAEFARDTGNIKTEEAASSATLLDEHLHGGKAEEVHPATLLTTDSVYSGGDTTQMDPRHSATAPLTELRFAMAEGTEGDMEGLAERIASAVASTGSVPAQVTAVYSTGETAENFHPAQVIGAMPDLSPGEDGESVGWQDRAAGAVTMQQALALMPEGHEAEPAVREYVAALANPAVGVGAVEDLGVLAIAALSPPDGGTGAADGGGGPPPPPPSSGGDGTPAAPAHDPAGLELARDVLNKVTNRRDQDGPEPEEPEDRSEDLPRGEGGESPLEYNPRDKKRRSGLYDYDDDEESA